MRGSPFFEGIHQVEVTSHGHVSTSPAFYYDVGFMEAILPARLGVLRAMLPDPRLVPLRLGPGVGAVALDCFEYRDSDIGPYNEVGISILVAAPGMGTNFPGRQLASVLRRHQGHAFIVHLPVTTEIARVLGVDFYNFPKFLADITFADTGDARICRLAEGEEHILALTGRRIPTPQRRLAQRFAHLWMNGQPQGAEVRLNQLERGMSFRPGAARVELGDRHPVALELGRMLLSHRSVGFELVPRQEAILYGPDHLTVDLLRRVIRAPVEAGVH